MVGAGFKLPNMVGGRCARLLCIAAAALALACQLAQAAEVYHDLHVTLMRGAPDCYPKTLIVANRQWQYPIEVTQGDTLVVSTHTARTCLFLGKAHGGMVPCAGMFFRPLRLPSGPFNCLLRGDLLGGLAAR
jgi:hypothetical protein